MNYLLILIFFHLPVLANESAQGADVSDVPMSNKVSSEPKTTKGFSEKDFKPEEEIPEDYPTHLPSDI